jgi:hypothetical protein
MAAFRYRVEPGEIKIYLRKQGYETKERYNQDGTLATGFDVLDTYIEVSYDILAVHPITGDMLTAGYGLVSLRKQVLVRDPVRGSGWWVESDPEKYRESLRLYRRLYRRFRRPPYEKK